MMPPRAPSDEGYHKAHELYLQGRREQAESQLRRFLQRQPRHAAGNNLMAILLTGQGRGERALYHAEIAVASDPRQVVYLNTLGVILTNLKRPAEAAAALRRGIEAYPNHPPVHNALGVALADLGDVEGAAAAFRRAWELAPGFPQPRANMAKLLLDTGRAAESCAELEAALQIAPEHRQFLSDLAGALNYIEADPQHVLEVHRRLGRAIEAGAGAPLAHKAGGSAGRLRVGYISADFRAHSVAYFFEPLLRARTRERFEVYCYHTSPESDAVTRRLKSLADHWRDVAALDDARLAERIRQDRLDVLVDLGGHTSGSRIAALARRPAPVQVNWCGYANTTGVRTIDFRIVDALTDPPGSEALAMEDLIRLPRCFLCYAPPAGAPEVGPPPSLEAGHVMFGSFNMLPKIGAGSVGLWSEVLKAVPGSRLVIKAKGIDLPGVRERLREEFSRQGIQSGRVEMIDFVPTIAEHLSLYGRIDIALDTYPYHGTTTTCEALWMGVPVVARVGSVHAARVGLSLLSAVGLGELTGESVEEVVGIAAALAGDRARLAELRRTLRERVVRSPLCDAGGFAQQFEEALAAAQRNVRNRPANPR
jgi:protein O-GlcNAc transferase